MDDCSTEPPRNTHETTNRYILYTAQCPVSSLLEWPEVSTPDLKQHVSVSQGIVPRLLRNTAGSPS